MSIVRPSLMLDFANARSLDPRVAFARASTATFLSRTGAWREAAANVPRFQHDAATGACLGILREAGATNSNRNPRGEGTGGTSGLPTNWSFQNAGLTATKVGNFTVDGVDVTRIRLNGTATGVTATVDFEAITGIVAAPGQSWASSFFYRTFSGAGVPIGYRFRLNGRTAAGAGVGGNSFNTVAFDPTGTLTRYERAETLTADGTLARVTAGIQFSLVNGAAYDFTFDVGWPQMELGSFATSPALPPVGAPAAAVRAADGISLALADFGLASLSEYTAIIEATAGPAALAADQVMAELHDGTANEAIQLLRRGSTGGIRGSVISGGVEQGPLDAAVVAGGGGINAALGVRGGDLAISLNGAAVVADATATAPAGLTTLHIGGARAGGSPISSALRRVAIYPRRLTNAQLQTLSAGV
jgi:hypothetical protein